MKTLLKKYSITPRKDVGQNFLVSQDIARKITNLANLSHNESVLEIGGGLGILTLWLAKKAKHVYVIEIDSKLVSALREILADVENIDVIEGDALQVALPDVDKVVANLPYSISSPVTFRLLDNIDFELAILMYQKEFAKRIIAKAGSTDYSRLTIEIQYRANVKEVMDVPAQMFYPVPAVDSSVISMTIRRSGSFARDSKFFHNMIRGIYSYPNKQLRKALRIWFKNLGLDKSIVDQILSEHGVGISSNMRLRNIPLESLTQLSDFILEMIENNRIPDLRRGDS